MKFGREVIARESFSCLGKKLVYGWYSKYRGTILSCPETYNTDVSTIKRTNCQISFVRYMFD